MTPEELADLAHLRRARDLLDREYARPLDVPAMARATLVSPSHVSRTFRAAYGETPFSYLMTRRIERAKALLRQGTSVTDACVTVGCTSLGSLSSRFTEIVGETPSQHRAAVASDGLRWVTVGAPGQDVDIVLFQPHGAMSEADGDAILTLVTKGALQAALLRADDLDTTFEMIRASNAEVLQEPAAQPWGVRDCAFRDPSANMVRISQG